MAYTEIECAQCGKIHQKQNGHIRRSRSIGAPLYCGMECAGLGRRQNKGIEQKKEEKRIYDTEYRAKNKAMLKAKKAAAFQNRPQERREYEKQYRKENMQRHVEYCRDPEYREKKKGYDQQYRAQKFYGEFWESSVLLTKLETELDKQMSWYERQMAKGTLNKLNQRRKLYERETSFR